MDIIEIIKSIILGIVEGITEWLPISSTGHMILLDEFINLKVSDSFMELFLVVIQLGAICAVPVLFFHKINPFSRRKSEAEKRATWNLWGKVVVGVMPAAIIGVFLDDVIEEKFYNYVVVSVALILYGVLFILIEELNKKRRSRVEAVEELTYLDAIKIGSFQVLSLIPGTSRSGSTIMGGLISGVSRTVSAEFSFFMAIPVMLGASALKILKFIMDGFVATSDEILLLVIGMVVSFAVSLIAIKFLMDFVKRHDFKPFGIYRIALGAIIILYFIIKNMQGNLACFP